MSIRPSVKKRIESALNYKNFYYTCDLCKKKEELYDTPDINKDIVKKIKAKLLEAGLHFGMTDEQLDDYAQMRYKDNQNNLNQLEPIWKVLKCRDMKKPLKISGLV